jgi:hypothetical protein
MSAWRTWAERCDGREKAAPSATCEPLLHTGDVPLGRRRLHPARGLEVAPPGMSAEEDPPTDQLHHSVRHAVGEAREQKRRSERVENGKRVGVAREGGREAHLARLAAAVVRLARQVEDLKGQRPSGAEQALRGRGSARTDLVWHGVEVVPPTAQVLGQRGLNVGLDDRLRHLHTGARRNVVK